MNNLKFSHLALAPLAALAGIAISASTADARPARPIATAGFNQMDANGDGMVSLAEMKAAHVAKRNGRKARNGNKGHWFKNGRKARMARKGRTKNASRARVRDRRYRRGINRKQLRRMTIAQRFAKIDVNGDGLISPAEMAAARIRRQKRHHRAVNKASGSAQRRVVVAGSVRLSFR